MHIQEMNIEELKLGDSYVFHVVAEYGSTHYAGELSLTPKRISLKILGEISEDGQLQISFGDMSRLICRDLTTTFLLIGLKFNSGWNTTIEYHPKRRGFFENVYEIDQVIHFPKGIGSEPVFDGIDIRSNTLSEWVGHTKNQDKIIHERQAGANLFNQRDLLEEFVVPISNEGFVGFIYNVSIFYNPSAYRAGLTFPPSLLVSFKRRRNPEETIGIFEELYTLFAFITGGELDIELMTLLYSGSALGSQRRATIYFPKEKLPQRNEHCAVLFPLSRNLVFNQSDFPEFPLGALGKYFALEEKVRRYFDKYVRYRRLENIEERFLGYFRILETVCSKKRFYFEQEELQRLSKRAKPYLVKYFGDAKAVGSFLKRLPKFNASRYNTEKCIQDFLETIPEDITRGWELQRANIGAVCKLRNDISHANDHEVDEFTMRQMTAFVEILLLFALFDRIGIDLRKLENILSRYDEYYFVKPPIL